MNVSSATLTDNCELILGDSANSVFQAADVTTYVNRAITEYSFYRPDHGEPFVWLAANNFQYHVDCNRKYIQHSTSDTAAYPVLLKDTNGNLIDARDIFRKRRKIRWGHLGFSLVLDTAPQASVTDQLTGTVTFTGSSTAITGSGTAFTSELRVGYFIKKGGKKEWYRVTAIASDTALTLGRNVVTADDGADTSGNTDYWRSDVVLDAYRDHVLTAQTDLAGAVDSGGASGYADGVWTIHVDALGTGQIDQGTLFTIAGTSGVYRVTADATIATNECDITIEPALQDRAVENAVVTFYPSTLDEFGERIIPELAAARIWIDTCNNAYDQIATALTEIGTTSAGEIALANAQYDQAVTDVSSARTADPNAIHVGSPIEGYSLIGQGDRGTGQGYLQDAASYRAQAGARINTAQFQAALRNMGRERLALVLRELKDHQITRTKKEWPTA